MKVYFEFAACASMKLRIKNIKGRKPSPRTKLNFFWDQKIRAVIGMLIAINVILNVTTTTIRIPN